MVLAEIFSNDMIFQRRKEICIFGTGDGRGKAEFCEQFGIKQEYCGPVYDKAEWFENGIKITFTHCNKLEIQGKYLEDTYVQNENNTSFTVDAEVEGNTLTLKWEEGIAALSVTMGYGKNPTHNLYNEEGYLASPFKLINETTMQKSTAIDDSVEFVS